MYRRTLPWLFTVVLIAALSAACSRQDAGTATDSSIAPAASDAAAAPSADTAASAQLTVTAPAGWTANKTNPKMMMKGTATYSITEDSMSGAANPDAYLAIAKAGFEKAFKNCVFTTAATLQVSGNEARRLEFSGVVSGLAMKYILLYVFKDGRVHLLTCGAMSDSFGEVKADYEAMVASAKLE